MMEQDKEVPFTCPSCQRKAIDLYGRSADHPKIVMLQCSDCGWTAVYEVAFEFGRKREHP